MNSKELGADMVFAWPGAEIGIMASGQAVGIVERRRIASANDANLAGELARAYADEHLTAAAAAASGFVDEVIEPEATRETLAWALTSLGQRR
jgi:methylmalonyl-CoA carboxyltransferase large subunit